MGNAILRTALLLIAVTAAQGQPPLLESLGREIGSLRSMPVGAESRSACPRDTGPLLGIDRNRIAAALGRPDFIDSDGTWAYFFTSPRPEPAMFGGGFPVLEFTFNAAGTVAHASCSYAR
jgi:hypothetical protein